MSMTQKMGLSKLKNSSTTSNTPKPSSQPSKKSKPKRKRGHTLSPVPGDEDVSMDAASMQEAKEALQEEIAAARDANMDDALDADLGKRKKAKGDHGTGAGINVQGRLVNKEGKELDYMKMYEKGSKANKGKKML